MAPPRRGRHLERVAAVLAGAVAGLLPLGRANAEGIADGTHGRVDGDVTLVAGVGAVAASRGPRAEGELRVRYLEAAGVFASYEDVLFASGSSEPRRVLAGGLELRPLFFYRWLRGLEARRGWVDLTLDSLGLEIGALLASSSRGQSELKPGLQLGLGIEVPAQPRATGVWLAVRGAVRWGQPAMALGSVSGPEDRAVVVTLTLSWHQVIAAHIVDFSDEAPL